MSEELDYDKLNSIQRYSQFAVFRAIPGALGSERSAIVAQTQEFFAKLEADGKVTVRGIYDITGINAQADFMIWFIAEEFEDIQAAYQAFRRDTVLGQCSEAYWNGSSLHRPSEFNRSHLPSFIMGEDPNPWITVYPFVRSYDWYVMDANDRRRILAEHGAAARDFADVRANTTMAFAMGDYEWMLAFEAESLHRLVDLMHKMRYTEARLHVREETPFFTGRRVDDVAEIVEMLP